MKKLMAADLFAGAGGTSIGAESTGACRVEFAVNHWSVAIETHAANFPHTKHVNSRLDQVNPSECQKINLLFASPECIHHSRARGGKPTSDQQRSGAWDIMRWIEHHRPTWIVVENVREFAQWGPCANGRPMRSKRGAFFEAWLSAIRAAGYAVDHRLLNAADFGAATSRERLFIVARKGRRAPVWPEPTHCEAPGGELPGLSLPRWRPAYEVIEWSIPCPSIFVRKRPLADKTLLRIEAGLRRFVGPFISSYHGGGDGLAMPFLVPFFGEAVGQGPRSHSICAGLPTITGQGAGGVAMPFVLPNEGFFRGNAPRSPGDPLPTITAGRGSGSVVVPILSTYYGNGGCRRADCPIPTITTKERVSLSVCAVCGLPPEVADPSEAMQQLLATMRELGVCDIGFRMLTNAELSAAQGFPREYIFAGNKGEVTRQIGNSVSPPVARAITEAIAA